MTSGYRVIYGPIDTFDAQLAEHDSEWEPLSWQLACDGSAAAFACLLISRARLREMRAGQVQAGVLVPPGSRR